MRFSAVYYLTLVALAILLLPSLTPVSYAKADKPALMLSSPFTGVTIEQGQTVSTNIKLTNNLNATSLNVEIQVEKPEGWEVELTYRGYRVFRIFLEPEDEETITVKITIPENAAPGVNIVTFRAQDIERGVASNEVAIQFNVVEKPRENPIELEVSFPSLSGSADDTLEYRFDLRNNLDREVTVGLKALNTPEGWVVRFKPSAFERRVISSITLEPKSRETGLVMEVKPVSTAKPGSYKITLVAETEGFTAQTEVTATITGRADYSLSTPNQLLSFEMGAGEEKQITIVVSNDGSEDLTGVSLSVSPPSGWSASLEPEEIALLRAGDMASVTLTVKPPANALAGDYSLRVSAYHPDVGSENLQFRVTVTKQTFWGVIGVAVVAASVAALLFVFWRFGRP